MKSDIYIKWKKIQIVVDITKFIYTKKGVLLYIQQKNKKIIVLKIALNRY